MDIEECDRIGAPQGHGVQAQELPHIIVGAGMPVQDAVHASGPQFTVVPVQASAVHVMLQGPSPQFRGTSPHASTPPSQMSVHGYMGGQLTVATSQASTPLQWTSQA